mmetsp:Transcript_160825/g.308894  ORF Transcript_160825/g.308894 Transcript_160825/m.308894 type:complete len:311 (+) Transcript_160825:45-977(+)
MLLANGGFLLVLLAVRSLQVAYTKRDSSRKAAIDIDTQSMLIEADGQVRQSFTSLEEFVLYVLQKQESKDNVTTCHMSLTPQEPEQSAAEPANEEEPVDSGAKQGEEASENKDNLSVGEKVLRKNAEAYVLAIDRTIDPHSYTVCMLEDGREVSTEREYLKKLSKDSKEEDAATKQDAATEIEKGNKWVAAREKAKEMQAAARKKDAAAEQCIAARKRKEKIRLEEEAKCLAKNTNPLYFDGEWDTCLLDWFSSKCQCVHASCETKKWSDAEIEEQKGRLSSRTDEEVADQKWELLSRKDFMRKLEQAIE